MSERQITIRMPKELLVKWLAALRTNRIGDKPIKQAQDTLHNGRGGYCCLGVLQVCAAGRVQRAEPGMELPGDPWLAHHGVRFFNSKGMPDTVPWLPKFRLGAADANDDGKTFAEIADAIEACAEGV